MIKYTKLPKNIELLLPKAEAYLKSRSDISFAYLFGGLAKGKPMPLSDVDIAVYISEGGDVVEKKWRFLVNLWSFLRQTR